MSFDNSRSLFSDRSFLQVAPPQPSNPQLHHQRKEELERLREALEVLGREGREGIARELSSQQGGREFLSQLHEYKFIQKKLVARALCNQDYGPEALSKEIAEYREIMVV
jgi:hypothetical protein